MARVLLVCVAGVSGTFLAKRIRLLDPTLDTIVASYDGVSAVIDSADVMLIAPQLAEVRGALQHLAPGIPAALLPAGAFAAGGAEIAVRTVHELLGIPDLTPERAEPAHASPGASS
jgi:cellobiose-specific phosphotransferase system component IIB